MPLNPLIFECLEKIITHIDKQEKPLSNPDLLQICRPLGEIHAGNINPHLPHEIAEAAVNFLIQQKYAVDLLASTNPQSAYSEILKPLVERLPTQTWRSREQIGFQQFSTPPGLAYLLTYILNLRPGEQVLEPSAGTGSLSVWASGAKLKTHTNEIDPRRCKLLCHLDFQPTSYNAEYINDFLSPEVRADVILMNPPFSSSGGRTKNNSSKFGFRHVQSALERLEKGGKFGIILGKFAELSTKTGGEFWEKMSDKIRVNAIITIAGREYYRNGTSIETTLIIGKKCIEERTEDWNTVKNRIIEVSAKSVADAFNIVQEMNLRLH